MYPYGGTPMVLSGHFGSYEDAAAASGLTTGSKSAANAAFGSNNKDDFDTGDHHKVPIWAWVLIGIGAALVVAFIVSSILHSIHERTIARQENRKARYGRAIVRGLKFALFFWVFSAIFNGVRSLFNRGKQASVTTSYSKVMPAGGATALSNYEKRSSRSSSYNDSMAYGGSRGIAASDHGDDVVEEPWSSAAYGDGGSGQTSGQYNSGTAPQKYEPYSSHAIGSGTSTTAVSVGPAPSSSVPYSPNSAYTGIGNIGSAVTTSGSDRTSHVPAPVHITPSVSPMATPLPTPANVNEPLMSSPAPSATYVPGQDSRHLY